MSGTSTMFTSDDDLQSILNRPDNLARRKENDLKERALERVEVPEEDDVDHAAIVPLNNGGRRTGDKNIPEVIRSIAGAAAHFDTLKNVSKEFGISLHHTHELKHGVITDYKGQDDNLVDEINTQLKTPHDIALEKLTETLLAITPEKIAAITKVKELASIANNLSSVAERSAPVRKNSERLEDCKLIVYAPTIQNENHYEKVTVTRG